MRLLSSSRIVNLPHRSPLVLVATAAVGSALIRFLVALQVQAPVYYPDEYLSTTIARSIATGEFTQARGGALATTYTSYFVPFVQSPFWAIDNVLVSFRLSQALGAVAFSLAAFPAFALARRIGISERGSLIVALLALAIPAGTFTATLLAEPYAYPLFLLLVLVSVEAISRPSLARHLAAGTGMAALCLVGGLQFLYFGFAYVIAWLLFAWPSRRALLQRLGIVLGASAALLLLLSASGQGRYIEILVGAVRYQSYPPSTLGSWFVVNAFVLAVAAGWLLVPGAVLGLRALGRSGDPRRVAFALLSPGLLLGMLFEAALWGANDFGVYERFTFYGAPLLATSFVWASEHTTPSRAAYAVVAYVATLAAVILPVTDPLFAADDQHAPTIDGLSELTFGSDIGAGIWAPVLAILAVGVAIRGVRNPGTVLILAISLSIVAGIGSSHVFVRVTKDRDSPPYVQTAPGSSILTWQGADPYLLLEALFWNPEITKVLLLGAGESPDGLPSTRAQFVPPGSLVHADGSPMHGPFVIAADAVVSSRGNEGEDVRALATLAEVPPLIGFGFRRQTGDLGRGGRIFAASGDWPSDVIIRLRSPDAPKGLGLSCTSGLSRRLDVGPTWVSVTVPVPAGSTEFCDLYLIEGKLDYVDGRPISVEARLALESHSLP